MTYSQYFLIGLEMICKGCYQIKSKKENEQVKRIK